MNYISFFIKLSMVISTIIYTLYNIYNIDYNKMSVDFSEESDIVDSRFRIVRQFQMLKKLSKVGNNEINPRAKLINYIIIEIFVLLVIYVIPSKNIYDFSLLFYTTFLYIIYKNYKDVTNNIIVKYLIPLYVIIIGIYSAIRVFSA